MFYLTLPSNSSQELFTQNTLSQFTTQLAQPVNLKGYWEVGLSEIQYPHTWYNMGPNDGWIKVSDDKGVQTVKLTAGQYNTPEQLMLGLNKLMESASQSTHIKFTYDINTQKATIKIARGRWLELSDPLTKMLGMEKTQYLEGNHASKYVVDVDQGFYGLYVYCSLVEPRPVGNTQVPLLRIVPIEGHSGQMITKTYENVQYVPVVDKHFRTLEIDIRKDTGEKVPFERGKLVVTLHFRRSRAHHLV